MVRVKTTAVTELKNSDCCDAIQNTVNLMTDNALFSTPSPSLADMQAAITNLRELDIESQNRERGIVADKRTARETLNGMFKQLCLYINFTVRNYPNAEDIIISLGLEVAKTGGHRVASFAAPVNLSSAVSSEPGGIQLEWQVPSQRGIHSYVVEIAEGGDTPDAQWSMFATATGTRLKATGLVRGNFYAFRVRSVGAGSVYSAPSEVTTCVAG